MMLYALDIVSYIVGTYNGHQWTYCDITLVLVGPSSLNSLIFVCLIMSGINNPPPHPNGLELMASVQPEYGNRVQSLPEADCVTVR